MGVVSLPSDRSARSRIFPGRVSERRTLPLLGLGRVYSRRTQRAFGTAMRLCASLSRGVAAPQGCATLLVYRGIYICERSCRVLPIFQSITKGAADSNIRIGALSGHDQNSSRRSKIQKLNIVRQHIRILQRMALWLPGRVFLHLKDMPIDARDLHRNIAQMQPWLPERHIDADVGIAQVTL